MNFPNAGLQLLIAILEFVATFVRMHHEQIGSDAEAPASSVGRATNSVPEAAPKVVPEALEVKLEEGESAHDVYVNHMMREKLKALAMQKPRRYYGVAHSRAPGIYQSSLETKPQMSHFCGSKLESFGTHEGAEAWLMQEINESIKYIQSRCHYRG